jgi:hypothetical protein
VTPRPPARGRRLSTYAAPRMPFSLTVDRAAALPRSVPGIASVEDLRLPPGRGGWGVVPGWVYRLSWVRNVRPSVSLLRFA